MVNVDHKFDHLKGGQICYPPLNHSSSQFLRPERELKHAPYLLPFIDEETDSEKVA